MEECRGKKSLFGPEIRKSEFVISSLTRDWNERKKIEPKSSIDISNISLNFSILKKFFDCPYSFKFWTFYGFIQPKSASKKIYTVSIDFVIRNNVR